MPENRRKKKKGAPKKRQTATKQPVVALMVLGRPTNRRQITLSWLRKRFVREFENTLGNISESCLRVGINRATYYRWMKSNARVNVKFRNALEAVNPVERLLDAAEHVVAAHLSAGNLRAAEIVLKSTKAKSRNYAEKQEETNEIDAELNLLRNKIKSRANQRGVSFDVELETYLEIFGSDIKPQIVEELTGKYIN